jgi:DNA-binding transcriptional LysR family regulator
MVDLAFVSTPYNAAKGLTAVKVKQFNDILIAGNSFADLKGKTLDYKDLLNYPFVCLRHTMQLRQFVDDIFAKKGLTITPDIEADGADLLVPMISHNFGLGIVPQSMAQDAISRGEVFQIPLKTALPPREIYMLTDPHHPQTNASRELMKNIVQYVKNHKQ